ncbi:hypothetical protein DAEQUDRAFT_723389 [Daedalea quercina L-15889]|uniref:Uncharacterized protein n=1 Tax=Daedalea quercina L-15889 TaxID=1314783 RepID=A0A165SLZ2_9APHY|nr:hypothetical protein DAEQUDRAFT_723389 [Daedalea quercina L-15889]
MVIYSGGAVRWEASVRARPWTPACPVCHTIRAGCVLPAFLLPPPPYKAPGLLSPSKWHASLEAKAAQAYAASAAPQSAGPSQERPSKFAREWHAALEEQAQLAARAVYGTPKAASAQVTEAVPTRQREIKRLFRVVEKELAAAECIGVTHPLLSEWQELQQHYVQLESEYQQYVGDCSGYLSRTVHIFQPEAFGGADVVQANAALTDTLRVVQLMQEDAKRVEYLIYDLQDEIEAFPARVMDVANRFSKPKSGGLSGWLKKLRASFSRPVKALLKVLRRSCTHSRDHVRLGSSERVAAYAEKHRLKEQPIVPSMKSCQRLLVALSDLVDASQLVERACDDVFQAGCLGTLVCAPRGETGVGTFR